MNHAITVIRHETEETVPVGKFPGVVFVEDHSNKRTDEEIIAHVLCLRKHDDKRSSEAAKECHTIHVCKFGPWQNGPAAMDPDPRCVERQTAALHRWNGTAAPELIVCGKD